MTTQLALLGCFVLATIVRGEDSCTATIVESLPDILVYPEDAVKSPTTYSAWKALLQNPEQRVEMAQAYWTMLSTDVDPPEVRPKAEEGESIFHMLGDISSNGRLTIVNSYIEPYNQMPNFQNDTLMLSQLGATVKYLNMPSLVGAGILHTKLIISNRTGFYVGSANTDWRALTMVKELGLHFDECDALVYDVLKIWAIYYDMAHPGAQIPADGWSSQFSTAFNDTNPMNYNLNGIPSKIYFAVSPPELCAEGRSSALDSILHVMDRAERFVYISVMDFIPGFIYDGPFSYWPVIQDKIKLISINRGVRVRLLISHWDHSPDVQFLFLQSLDVIRNISGIEIKLFTFPPPLGQPVPYTHVSHAKYMVTDNTAYITTNNWTADYFVYTAGIATVINQTEAIINDESIKHRTTQEQLRKIFERDWDSVYARPLPCPDCKQGNTA